VTPDRVTTDGHDSYPRAIRTELGKNVRHRTSAYLNNRLEQDRRGIKGRDRPMRGFKCPDRPPGSAGLTMSSATFSASAPVTTSMFPPIARGCCSFGTP
jgi:transposase-like protein